MGDMLYDGTLEVAYQKFIHTPDIPVASLNWIDEEEKQLNRLNAEINK
jgi:hypothetical protein